MIKNKADEYIKSTIGKIISEGIKDQNPRPKYSDGVAATSKFITQQFFVFDISKGEFPISTLRNGSIKMAFQEMKTIFIDQSNKDSDFKKNGIYWWTPWMNEQGDLGTAYSYNIESGISENICVIDYKKVNIDDYIDEEIKINEIEGTEGPIHSNCGSPFKVIDDRFEKTSNGQYKYKIQFLDTGSYKVIRGNDLNRQLKNGVIIKDPYNLSNYKVGYVKNNNLYKEYPEERVKWRSMLKRCYYYKDNKNYDHAYVDSRWHVFDNFIEDIKYIPNYFLAKKDNFKGWSLDKDYFTDSKVYSKETSVFIPDAHNTIYATGNPLELLDKEEKIIKYYIKYSDAEKDLGLTHLASSFYRARKKGESAITLKSGNILKKTNKIIRYGNSRNQVVELLKNLEADKFSRRHMLSFFNWPKQNEKQLVECAFQSLFSVRVENGMNIIDQTLIQRSSDFLVAGMINCSQYVMLGMIICNHLKYKTQEDWKLGKFTWFIQNCHLYDRHIEGAEEILQRESTGLQPKIELVCEPKDFFQHRWEDFKVSGTEGVKPLSKTLVIAI